MVQKRSYRKIINQNKKGGFLGVYVVIGKLKFLFDYELHLQLLSRLRKTMLPGQNRVYCPEKKKKLFPGLNRVYCPDRK